MDPHLSRWRRSRAMAAATALLAVVGLLVVADAPAATAVTACTAGTGPRQREVEAYLRLRVDGRNSVADCRAIRGFQRNNDIVPAAGYAGPLTGLVVARKRTALGRAALCPAMRRVVCVDLTSQMMWIAEQGRRTWGPFAVRSGRNGFETRTTRNRGGDCRSRLSRGAADWCTVYWRDRDHWNSHGDHMPYAMFFDGGEAFHTYRERYIYDPLGSHGCVHMLPSKAPWLWDHLPRGTRVVVFGRKPGT
jgi:hypothetical protein